MCTSVIPAARKMKQGSQVQAQPRLHGGFQVSLGYKERSCHIKKFENPCLKEYRSSYRDLNTKEQFLSMKSIRTTECDDPSLIDTCTPIDLQAMYTLVCVQHRSWLDKCEGKHSRADMKLLFLKRLQNN